MNGVLTTSSTLVWNVSHPVKLIFELKQTEKDFDKSG